MNQELKNMDLVVKSLEEALLQREYNAAKTLSHTYERMTINYMKKHHNQRLSDDHFLQLEKLKELHSDIVNNKIPQVISQVDYTSLNSLQLTSERLDSILQDFKQDIDSHKLFNSKTVTIHKGEEIAPKKDTKQLLDLSIKNGVLITQVDDKLRGTGKTVSLIEKAHELDVTLLVGTHRTKKLVDELAAQMGVHIDCRYINNLDALKGRRLKNNKFLVDDSVPNITIQELRKQMNEFVGGFNSLSDSLMNNQPKTEVQFLYELLNKAQNDLDVLNYLSIQAGHVKFSKVELINKTMRKIEALKEVIKHFDNK